MISYMWAVLNWFKEDLLTVTWSKLLQSLTAEGEKSTGGYLFLSEEVGL